MNQSLIASSTYSNIINEQQSQNFNQLIQENNQEKKSPSILNLIYFTPQSRFIIIWQLINLLLIYIYFIQIPITIAFENHRSEYEAEFIFEIINIPAIIIFICTIFIKLKTSYYQNGILISDQQKVIKNYLKYYFALDFLSISSVCIYQFSQIISEHQEPISYRFIVLLFYLKIYEVFIIEKNIINSFDLNRKTKALLKLMKLLMKVFLICNISACGFFYLSDRICNHLTGEVCWIDQYKLGRQKLRDQYWSVQYACSLYWASTTMISIGYGDIVPCNVKQVIYTLMMQFCAALIFAYCLNTIWSIAQQLNSKKLKINNRMNIMNIYMRDKKVNSQLKSRINAYLAHYYHTKNLRERQIQKQIIQELTPSLRKQLHYETYGFVFRNHSFFNQFNQNLLFQSSIKVFQIGLFQGQLIIKPLTQNPKCSLYYVYKGKFCQFLPTGMNQLVLQRYSTGNVIGLYNFVTQIATLSIVKTQEYSLVYCLLQKDWKQLLKGYSKDFEKFHEYRCTALFYKYLNHLQIHCYFCNSDVVSDHISEKCFDEKIKKKYLQTVKKFKNKCQRINFKRKIVKSSKVLSTIETQIRRGRKQSFDMHDQLTNSPKNISKTKGNIKSGIGSNILSEKKKQNLIGSLKIKMVDKVNKERHLKRMQTIIKQNDIDSESQWSEQSQIVIIVTEVDKVRNYQHYFKHHNSDNQGNRDKRGRLMASMRI